MIERSGAPRAQAAALDDTVCPGDRIRVGALGRAAVQLANEAETPIRLDEGTTLIFPAPEPEKSFLLKLIEGVVHVLSREPQVLTIETPFVFAGVEGTEFVLGVSKSEAELWVFEGRVRVSNPQGQLEVRSGEGALARPGQAPVRRVLVKPREAVEWALYYPPLVDPRPESYPPALRATLSAYRANDLPAAFAALERVPAGDRDGRYLVLRAGLLLSVGRVAKAEADLAEAERADSKSGGAPALRSVIALVRDQKDEALRLAETGAGLDPKSPLPQAALSYAHQGRFEIEKALEHAKRAVELAPEDALLWARVSELELSRGDLDAALEAAKKAEALSPVLARTQTVLGFAYLTRIEVDKAKSAFQRAIQGDPADPLPRLGLGLAKIRDGDLDEGTREIETAASLDPNNSLVRSYLGKAYYEQKRDGLASSEYEQAKLLDPKDPTPWFYDAIHKQTTNRPVEALHDVQRAIDLNDNRAVYRSRLLLDQDLAARSAALGRIYRDLGFEQLALVQGWKSVNTDPGDYSGHRLLADSYSVLPQHGIARVSELLQSQLRQPLSLTPVQPHLAERDLLILEGAGSSSVAFNEYNPVFARNRLTLQASGVAGSNQSYGDEVTQSGVWNKLSYSVGQFHYETDGFRENNDLTEDIYNVFVQTNLSPSLSLQAEARQRRLDHGDLQFNFDLDLADNFRRELYAKSVRLGAHYVPATHLDFIASATYLTNDSDQDFGGFPVKDEDRGYLFEAQSLSRGHRFNVLVGGSFYHVNGDSEIGAAPFLPQPFLSEPDIRHGNAYVYSYVNFPSQVTWTLGLSFDALDIDVPDVSSRSVFRREFDQLNPKLGLMWDITPNTTLRLAALRELKRTILFDQTTEPTQVAGFNQFFDDPTGAESRRYGVGLDHKFFSVLYGGVEVSRRDLIVPRGISVTEDWEEELYRGYLNWTPHPTLALGLGYHLEQFEDESTLINPSTRTQLFPVELRYFHPSGLFGSLKVTYTRQQIGREIPLSEEVTIDDRQDDEFTLIDLALGYRLPKRYGILRLGVKNLFDEEFSFLGIGGFRTPRREDSPLFVPEQTAFAQFTLAF
ncbi:MAG: TonB-dependent receptor domain-containing protein [Gammaproteobacteria bacterium]